MIGIVCFVCFVPREFASGTPINRNMNFLALKFPCTIPTVLPVVLYVSDGEVGVFGRERQSTSVGGSSRGGTISLKVNIQHAVDVPSNPFIGAGTIMQSTIMHSHVAGVAC